MNLSNFYSILYSTYDLKYRGTHKFLCSWIQVILQIIILFQML